jgi:peptidoglycan-N-acetylglucosamine deacetylase
MSKEILIAYGIDVDAVAGWIGTYGGEDSLCDISRGVFAGEVGIPRLLRLFDRWGIETTWFVPGHSIETFPEQLRAVAAAGHEIGMHGYSHENPMVMSRDQEEAVADRCISLITELAGIPPRGYVAPWWEFSQQTIDLLLRKGIIYDHSLMHNDFHPYYARRGDSWTKIDYGRAADSWMKPMVRGVETDLVEISASWYLDDLPPMMFMKAAPNSHGFVNPRDIEELWRDQFNWVYNEYDYAVLTFTLHPDVSGRPQVLAMHQRLFDHISAFDGVRFAPFHEIAADFLTRYPRATARRPSP